MKSRSPRAPCTLRSGRARSKSRDESGRPAMGTGEENCLRRREPVGRPRSEEGLCETGAQITRVQERTERRLQSNGRV